MNRFIDWNTLDLKKTSGKEKIRCPHCDDSRSDKKDKSLLINHADGYGKCFYCEALTFRDNEKNKRETKVNYTLPNQEWHNYTNLSDNLVKWFESRGIKQYVLKDFCISEEVMYQPQLNKSVNNVVFNYFESDLLVNKKYRSANKKFTQSKNGKPILYNINSVIGCDEVYICEGEIDVLSLAQIGIKNAVSLPTGANDNDAFWINSEKYLKDVKKFYIATDNDEKGNEVAEKIAQRLGRYRCERVIFNGKDANDDLVSGCLEETILNTEKYPVSGTYSISDVWNDVLDLLDKGIPETIKPKGEWCKGFNEIFSVMKGHLITITGVPSHGKSNFTDWYILNLLQDYGMKASWFSPEHNPMSLYVTNLATKALGTNFFKATPQQRNEFKEWANERIYLTNADGSQEPNWEWLLDTFQNQMMRYGIDIFVIDAWNKVVLNDKNELQGIRRVLTKLTAFAQQNNVMIFLVAHPTKMKKNDKSGLVEMPTLYDVAGSADFRNQTHDGFCVYRVFGEGGKTIVKNLKTKMTFQGDINKEADFYYNEDNGRYYDCTTQKNNLPLWSTDTLKPNPYNNRVLPTPTLREAFDIPDDDTDCPF